MSEGDEYKRSVSPPEKWVRFEEMGSNSLEEAATIEPSVQVSIGGSTTTVFKASPPHNGNGDAATPEPAIPPPARIRPSSNHEHTLSPTSSNNISPPPSYTSLSPSSNVDISGAIRKPHMTSSPPLHAVVLTEEQPLPLPSTNNSSIPDMVNGDVIVNLLPTNESCAWVTKADFRPELVPEELMAPQLTLTVEDYVHVMRMLVNDFRFNLYNICYKRLMLFWVLLGFLVLMCLLFSGAKGLALFGGGIMWLIINAVGIFVCMWLKFKLYHLLERCMAGVNEELYKHKILLGLDDRGKLSCHKVNLIFIFFDCAPCIRYLDEMLSAQERNEARNAPFPVQRSRMDIDTTDIVITGSSTSTRVSQKEKYAEKLLLRYSQRWVKEFVRKRLDLSIPVHPDGLDQGPFPPSPPRHCTLARCPCQFIEEHLRFKPLSKCSWSELCF